MIRQCRFFPPQTSWFESAADFPALGKGLAAAGFNEEEINGILGEKLVALFFARFLSGKIKTPAAPMRPPSRVMRLECLGALHQSRISFMRALFARYGATESGVFRGPLWKINAAGVGCAVYRFEKGRRIYSLAVYAHDLPPDKRTDRVIAEAWDATFSLYDGALSAKTAEDMQKDVGAQEAGRQHSRQLVLSRANRSVRLFDYVVDALAHGRQPETTKPGRSRLSDENHRRLWQRQIWHSRSHPHCQARRKCGSLFAPNFWRCGCFAYLRWTWRNIWQNRAPLKWQRD